MVFKISWIMVWFGSGWVRCFAGFLFFWWFGLGVVSCGFLVFALVDALWFGNFHVFFFSQLVWCSCSLTLGLLFDFGFDVVVGLWLLGFDDFLVLNFLGLWLRDLMILLGLKMSTEFLFWAYDFFLSWIFWVSLWFLKKISRDEPKKYEHVLQKKILKEIKFFNLIILFYFKRI